MNLHLSHRAHLERRQDRAERNVTRLMNKPGGYGLRRLNYWANLSNKLENMLHPITPPTPEEAAQFRAEQEGRA